MRFRVHSYTELSRATIPPTGAAGYLQVDTWDDFGWKTLFDLRLATEGKMHELGRVKVLHLGSPDGPVADATASVIPREFDRLPASEFCSLGQSMDYYAALAEMGPTGLDVLSRLGDVTLRREERDWTKVPGFSNSLLRFSDAQKAFLEASALLSGSRIRIENLSFEYAKTLPGATAPHRLQIHFDATRQPPRRINVLIGSNGVGKSTLLSELASDLADGQMEYFPRPPTRKFSRQILVSTSPFDIDRRPSKDTRSSYRFVGTRWRFERLLKELDDFDRQQISWTQWIAERLPTAESLRAYLAAKTDSPEPSQLSALFSSQKQDWQILLEDVVESSALRSFLAAPEERFGALSAGQQALITILVGLATEMDEESIVLIDEPENHLHPRFLKLLVQALFQLLEVRNSYAIIATHDPLVLQDVPADSVHIISRDGTEPRVRRLPIQSFGTALAALSMDVFRVDLQFSLWAKELKKLAETVGDVNAIAALFNPPLEPEVQAYLFHLVRDRR